MTITERIQADSERRQGAGPPRVAALRLVLDALNKEAKEARADLDEQREIAVLKRERKRRAEAAEAYRKGGRDEAARAEEAEAEMIDAYLPEQISDEELEALVADARRRDRRRLAAGDGQGDVGGDVEGGRPRRRQARQRAGRSGSPADRVRGLREQITLEPAVATELAGSEDAVLKALEGHLDCDVFLRGNVLTLDGEPRRRRGRAARWSTSCPS